MQTKTCHKPALFSLSVCLWFVRVTIFQRIERKSTVILTPTDTQQQKKG